MTRGGGRGPWTVLAAVLVGTFTGAINASIANVAVLDVMEQFDLDVSTGAWLVLGYVVAFVVLMPVVGRLAGRIGVRRVYLAGMLVFVLASVAAALSPNFAWLAVARILQGVGAAPVLPVVMLVVAREFPPGFRGRAMGVWAAVNGAALALGPVVGGVIVEAAGWRLIFWMDVPLALCAVLLAYVALPPDRPTVGRRVDLASVVLLCCGTLAVMSAVADSPAGEMGDLLRQVATLAIGVLLLAGFWRRSSRVPADREPVVGVRVLRNKAFGALAGVAALQMVLLAIVLFATPLMLSAVLGYSMATIGVLTFLVPLSMVLFGPASGYLSDRLGVRRLAIAGSLLLFASTATLAAGVGGRSLVWLVVGLVVTGTGVAAIQAPVAVAAAERVPAADRGAAMGLFHGARFAGTVIGTSASAGVVELAGAAGVDDVTAAALQRAFVSTYLLATLVAAMLVALVWWLHPADGGRRSPRSRAVPTAEARLLTQVSIEQ